MTSCKKVMLNSKKHRLHADGRETLAMSVIVEEPASLHESRLDEVAKHSDNENLVETTTERPQRSTLPDDLAPRAPESPVDRSESRSKSRLPISRTRLSHQHLRTESHSPRDNAMRSPCPISSLCFPHSEPEYTPRSKPSKMSFVEEERGRSDHHERPRRQRSYSQQSTTTRPKTSSLSQSKACPPSSKIERRQSPTSSTGLPKERPRSKSSSIQSTPSNNVNEYRERAEPRQVLRSRSSSRERRRSKSSLPHGKSQMPPFRRPANPVEDDIPSSTLRSQKRSDPYSPASADHDRTQHGTPSRHVAVTTSDRIKSSSPLNSLASLSEHESYEDRRLEAFNDGNAPARQRSTSNPKPALHDPFTTHRRFSSCREAKRSVALNPTLLSPKPSKDKQRPSSHPLLSTFDPISLVATEKGAIHRSASASRMLSPGSAPPLWTSIPEIPLRLRHYEGRFPNRRKQTLFYFSLFPPEERPIRGVVLYLHGIGDHCRRNVSLYERLCREGFGVITYDLLNHGVSDLDQHKTRAHVSDFNDLVADTNDFITYAKRSICVNARRSWRKQQRCQNPHNPKSNTELPLIIAGTSFGSLIGIHTILSGQHTFRAAVWGSPTIGVTWKPMLWAESKLGKPLSAIFPKAKMMHAVQHNLLSRDPQFLKRFEADPLTSMEMTTTRTQHESLQAMIRLQEDARVTNPRSAFCAVPTLFLAGSADGISDQQAAIKFFGLMGNFDKEFKLFHGLYHLVYEEPEREDVFRYLVKWLHRRFPFDSDTRA